MNKKNIYQIYFVKILLILFWAPDVTCQIFNIPQFCSNGLISKHIDAYLEAQSRSIEPSLINPVVTWDKDNVFFEQLQLIDLINQIREGVPPVSEESLIIREKEFLENFKKSIFKIFWIQTPQKDRKYLKASSCSKDFLYEVLPKKLVDDTSDEIQSPLGNKKIDQLSAVCDIETDRIESFSPFLSQGVINFYLANRLFMEDNYNPNHDLAFLCIYWQDFGYIPKGEMAPKTYRLNKYFLENSSSQIHSIIDSYKNILRNHIKVFFDKMKFGKGAPDIIDYLVKKTETIATYTKKNALRILHDHNIFPSPFIEDIFNQELSQVVEQEAEAISKSILKHSHKLDIILSRRKSYLDLLLAPENKDALQEIGVKLNNLMTVEPFNEPLGIDIFKSEESKENYSKAYKYFNFFNSAKATLAMNPEPKAIKWYFKTFGEKEGLKIFPNGYKDTIWFRVPSGKHKINIDLDYLHILFDGLKERTLYLLPETDVKISSRTRIIKNDSSYYVIKPDRNSPNTFKINLHQRSGISFPVSRSKYLKIVTAETSDDYVAFLRKILRNNQYRNFYRFLGSPSTSTLLELALLKQHRGTLRAAEDSADSLEAINVELLKFSKASGLIQRITGELESYAYLEEKLRISLPLWKEKLDDWSKELSQMKVSPSRNLFVNLSSLWMKLEKVINIYIKGLIGKDASPKIIREIKFDFYSQLLMYLNDKLFVVPEIAYKQVIHLDLGNYFFFALLKSIGLADIRNKETLDMIVYDFHETAYPKPIKNLMTAAYFCEESPQWNLSQLAKRLRSACELRDYPDMKIDDLSSLPSIRRKKAKLSDYLVHQMQTEPWEYLLNTPWQKAEFRENILRYFMIKIHYAIATFFEDPNFYSLFYKQISIYTDEE